MSETKIEPKIHASWKEVLSQEFHSPYFLALKQFLLEEKVNHKIYPPGKQIFAAFDLTPFDRVKVVILGQDPYHGSGQAHGLSFSVQDGIRQPPSLKNIFKEINNDLGHPIPQSGNLEPWAKQGVLLLNATLTVRASEPGSHQKKGWETFTDRVIQHLSANKEGLVFMLWGKFAQAKETLIDTTKHHVLKTTHPSPYSASYGFLGSKHFSKTNAILKSQGMEEINWQIT